MCVRPKFAGGEIAFKLSDARGQDEVLFGQSGEAVGDRLCESRFVLRIGLGVRSELADELKGFFNRGFDEFVLFF